MLYITILLLISFNQYVISYYPLHPGQKLNRNKCYIKCNQIDSCSHLLIKYGLLFWHLNLGRYNEERCNRCFKTCRIW